MKAVLPKCLRRAADRGEQVGSEIEATASKLALLMEEVHGGRYSVDINLASRFVLIGREPEPDGGSA